MNVGCLEGSRWLSSSPSATSGLVVFDGAQWTRISKGPRSNHKAASVKMHRRYSRPTTENTNGIKYGRNSKDWERIYCFSVPFEFISWVIIYDKLSNNLGKLVFLLSIDMIVIYVFVMHRYIEAKGLGVQVNKTRDSISKSWLSIPIIWAFFLNKLPHQHSQHMELMCILTLFTDTRVGML